MENPCFEYDPIAEQEMSDTGAGISLMGVDILPTELPRESSQHFGDALVLVVQKLLHAKLQQDAKTRGIDTSLLPHSLVRKQASH